jgi:predicted histidine transporter YuiF (NhaC family)
MKKTTGLFLMSVGVAIAFSPVFAAFVRQLPNRNLFLDGPDANSLELWYLMFTLPIGTLVAIFGLVQRFDAKRKTNPAPVKVKEEHAEQPQASKEEQTVYQQRSGSPIALIVIAMFIGLNICLGAVSSFMNMSLHESWGLFGALQLVAGGGIIFWGIRRLKKK